MIVLRSLLSDWILDMNWSKPVLTSLGWGSEAQKQAGFDEGTFHYNALAGCSSATIPVQMVAVS